MSGVAVIGALLFDHAPTVGKVPAERIKAGALPRGTPLPALEVSSISRVRVAMLRRGAIVRWTERVQVTAIAANYADIGVIVSLAIAACDGALGNYAGVTDVDVQEAGAGPDFVSQAPDIYSRSQDFRVSYNAAA